MLEELKFHQVFRKCCTCLIDGLNYLTKQNSSSEADRRLANKEISRLLWKPKGVRKILPLDHILNQLNPIPKLTP
jgi:hypothetical protein